MLAKVAYDLFSFFVYLSHTKIILLNYVMFLGEGIIQQIISINIFQMAFRLSVENVVKNDHIPLHLAIFSQVQ